MGCVEWGVRSVGVWCVCLVCVVLGGCMRCVYVRVCRSESCARVAVIRLNCCD